MCGYELGAVGNAGEPDWGFADSTQSTLTVTSTVGEVLSGGFSRKAVATASSTTVLADDRFAFTGVLGRTYFARARFKIPTAIAPNADVELMAFYASTIPLLVIRYVQATRTMQLRASSMTGTQIGSDSAAIALDTEFVLELALNIGSGSVDVAKARLNGTEFASASGLAISDSVPNGLRVGLNVSASLPVALASGSGLIWDDVAINDDQGTAQNSYPGSSRIRWMPAASDSADGTDWALGNGTAISSNAFDSVNNVPPTGKSNSTAAAGNQVRDTVSNASSPNATLDLLTQTPAAYGLASGDTITALRAQASMSQSVSSPTIAFLLKTFSNPDDGNSTNLAGVAGSAGTWPTGWTGWTGTILSNPTVSHSSAIGVRLQKGTATTTGLLCCVLGVMIDVAPATNLSLSGSASDSIAISDSASCKVTLARSVSDTVGVSDSGHIHSVLTRSTADSVAINDSPSRQLQLKRTPADSVTITDQAAQRVSLQRSTSDSIGITDSGRSQSVIRLHGSDTIAISEGVSTTVTLSRATQDTITIVDAAMGPPSEYHIPGHRQQVTVGHVELTAIYHKTALGIGHKEIH